MDYNKARSGCITHTKIQIQCEYSDIDPNLETCSKLDQSKLGASWGTE